MARPNAAWPDDQITVEDAIEQIRSDVEQMGPDVMA